GQPVQTAAPSFSRFAKTFRVRPGEESHHEVISRTGFVRAMIAVEQPVASYFLIQQKSCVMSALIAFHPASLGLHQTPDSFGRLAQLGLKHLEWPVQDSRFLEPFDAIPLLHEASNDWEIGAALQWFADRGLEVVSADMT